MAKPRFVYDYSPTRARSDQARRSIGHWHRYEEDNLVFEVGRPSMPASKRAMLVELIGNLDERHALFCTNLYALGCAAGDILVTLEALQARGVEAYCYGMPVNNIAARRGGSSVMATLKQLVQLEGELRAERISSSLASARAGGVKLGRPMAPSLQDKDAINDVLQMIEAGDTYSAVARKYGVHRRTIQRLWQQHADRMHDGR